MNPQRPMLCSHHIIGLENYEINNFLVKNKIRTQPARPYHALWDTTSLLRIAKLVRKWVFQMFAGCFTCPMGPGAIP